MTTKNYVIKNSAGLHTRPSADIVKIINQFNSDCFLIKNDFRANGRSIIGVMTLGASNGSNITIEINGPDETEAMTELSNYFERELI